MWTEAIYLVLSLRRISQLLTLQRIHVSMYQGILARVTVCFSNRCRFTHGEIDSWFQLLNVAKKGFELWPRKMGLRLRRAGPRFCQVLEPEAWS
nr:MAG TPA: protein of unknown function (DUF2024) [Caudoviricetes sp.]